MEPVRVRRAILLFLILLTLIVFARIASSADGGPSGGAVAARFARSRVALYDPTGTAAPALAALGLRPEIFRTFEGLALFQGDLIVVGPDGFSRGHEALGPILAARVRTGMRLLLLDQSRQAIRQRLPSRSAKQPL